MNVSKKYTRVNLQDQHKNDRLVEDLNIEHVTMEMGVIWASVLASPSGFTGVEMSRFAKAMAESEFSRSWINVALENPLAHCRIYPSGKVAIMGALSEAQALKHLARLLYKLRYHTLWRIYKAKIKTKALKPQEEMVLKWRYVPNTALLKVKQALSSFKIDHIYAKMQLKCSDGLDLHAIADAAKPMATFSSLGTLRIQVQIPRLQQQQPASLDSLHQNADLQQAWDIATDMVPSELEAELASLSKATSDVKSTAIILVNQSGKVAIFGCNNRQDLIDAAREFLKIYNKGMEIVTKR